VTHLHETFKHHHRHSLAPKQLDKQAVHIGSMTGQYGNESCTNN